MNAKVAHQCHLIRSSAQLRIELHADVGVILGLILKNMRSLHALRHHTISTIGGLLDPEIHVGILAWQNEHEHLWTSLGLIASGLEGGCNGSRNIVFVAKGHGRLGVDHISSVTFVDVDER